MMECYACEHNLFPGHLHKSRPVDVPRYLAIDAILTDPLARTILERAKENDSGE